MEKVKYIKLKKALDTLGSSIIKDWYIKDHIWEYEGVCNEKCNYKCEYHKHCVCGVAITSFFTIEYKKDSNISCLIGNVCKKNWEKNENEKLTRKCLTCDNEYSKNNSFENCKKCRILIKKNKCVKCSIDINNDKYKICFKCHKKQIYKKCINCDKLKVKKDSKYNFCFDCNKNGFNKISNMYKNYAFN